MNMFSPPFHLPQQQQSKIIKNELINENSDKEYNINCQLPTQINYMISNYYSTNQF